jgi:uncharacterized membrane protein YcaP (DUF421 family)
VEIIIRAAVIYLFVYVLLRALGKRELSEFTPFELVLLFIIGDLVQQSITQNDTSMTAAILAIGTISMLILAQSYVAFRWQRSRSLLDGRPIVVLLDGDLIQPALRSQRMTADDVRASARAAGIADLADVQIAILEQDGKLSFVKYDRQRSAEPESRHAE